MGEGGKDLMSHNVILWEAMPSLLKEVFARFIFHYVNGLQLLLAADYISKETSEVFNAVISTFLCI